MVLSALSALGIQGKSHNISSPWFVDSGASNHMAGTSEHLTNVRTYNGTQNIQIADGNTLSITAVSDITPSFRNVFVSPGLVSNLISVGQLVVFIPHSQVMMVFTLLVVYAWFTLHLRNDTNLGHNRSNAHLWVMVRLRRVS